MSQAVDGTKNIACGSEAIKKKFVLYGTIHKRRFFRGGVGVPPNGYVRRWGRDPVKTKGDVFFQP